MKTIEGNRSPSDKVSLYEKKQISKHERICRKLRKEIDLAMPKALSKMYYAMPVWFIEGIPVVSYNATSEYVNLMFWNGQEFHERGLLAAGKYHAAQIKYTDASEIDEKSLRRWLKKAKSLLWDYHRVYKNTGK